MNISTKPSCSGSDSPRDSYQLAINMYNILRVAMNTKGHSEYVNMNVERCLGRVWNTKFRNH